MLGLDYYLVQLLFYNSLLLSNKDLEIKVCQIGSVVYFDFSQILGLIFGIKKIAWHCYLILALLVEAHNKKRCA